MTESRRTNTKAVASLTLGILSILLLIIPPYMGWVLGIIGLVYGNKSLKEIETTGETGRNLAIAGRICSIVGIVAGGIFALFILFGMMAIGVYMGG